MMNKEPKAFIGFRIPIPLLDQIKAKIATDPEADLSSFIRQAIRREMMASGYIDISGKKTLRAGRFKLRSGTEVKG